MCGEKHTRKYSQLWELNQHCPNGRQTLAGHPKGTSQWVSQLEQVFPSGTIHRRVSEFAAIYSVKAKTELLPLPPTWLSGTNYKCLEFSNDRNLYTSQEYTSREGTHWYVPGLHLVEHNFCLCCCHLICGSNHLRAIISSPCLEVLNIYRGTLKIFFFLV